MRDAQGTLGQTAQFDVSELLPSAAALTCLNVNIAERLNVLPIALLTQTDLSVLVLLCVDSLDLPLKERLARHTRHEYELRLLECPATHLLPAIAECYKPRLPLDRMLALAHEDKYCAVATTEVSEFPVELLNCIILQAVSMGASDIHLSPEAVKVQLRLRVDGVLLNFASFAKSLLGGLLVRIKIMASLDIAESRYPQDGQFRRVVEARSVDFRVSTFPTVEGENVVMRLIDTRLHRFSVSTLNLPVQLERKLLHLMSKPDGLIVVCGPTGAGKSTTLFALLDTLDRHSRSVMTLEDPVEHRLEGVRQTTIDASRQWGYAQGLRALLRQDPDVLLIGEIRDTESCRMALRAVSTGHQVLTTVHAAHAHAALHRLRELEAGEAALALGLVAVVAQQLLRRVCVRCKGADKQCSQCHGTGYSGRQVIMELLEVSEDVRSLISQGADIAHIRKLSGENGFVELREQAMQQVAAGHTTLEEVVRVLG